MSNGIIENNVPVEEECNSVDKLVPSPESVIKHPLNNTWTLWYFINDKALKWEENLVQIASCNTVEDFWALFNHVESASRLKAGCDYSLFKEGIRPMWEDVRNVNGGRWSISLNKAQRMSDLDGLWLEMLMLMIGESAEESINDDITGAVVNIRNRGDRLALWTSNSKKSDLVNKIGKILRASLSIPPGLNIEYNLHSDTSNKRSSTVRALYIA